MTFDERSQKRNIAVMIEAKWEKTVLLQTEGQRIAVTDLNLI